MRLPLIHFLPLVLRQARQLVFALLVLGTSLAASAQEFVWAPDFPVGAAIPDITAQDQDGVIRTFDELVGENGMLFMMSRSFDW